MRSRIVVFSIFIFCLCALHLTAQVITLQNPSFEDLPRKGGELSPTIRSWHDCGTAKFPGESPPDIHPVPYKAWEVSKEPYDGLTFLGMVTRYNDTYESLSQVLSSPIQKGFCYSFSAFISKSQLYKSGTARSDSIENFDRPIVMRIWGGNSFCHKGELLGETPAVNNFDWKHYKFLFQPKGTYKYFTIEAFYKTPILEAYNGHILVDKLSDIVPVACPLFPQNLVAKVFNPPTLVEAKPSTGSTASNTTTRPKTGTTTKPAGNTTTPAAASSFKADLLPELDAKKVFVGQKIRINHLYFKADSVNLLPGSHKVLNELAAYLKAYPKTIIEIGGHTNTIPSHEYCDMLSTARAKSVQDYLISQGVPDNRLEYKGYGKRYPLIPYDKYNKDAKFKNQRVEIRILSLS